MKESPAPRPPEYHSERAQFERFVNELDRRKPIATQALIGVCVAVFLLQQVFAQPLYAAGAGVGYQVESGELWRLWSATFLHGGTPQLGWNVLHIASNMYALYLLGPFLEQLLGTARFVVLYALCGLAGSLASGLLHPFVHSVGASGAIWGLMTAWLALAIRPNDLLPAHMAVVMRHEMIQAVLINLGISFVPGIDMFAHFGGGAAGFLLVLTGLITAGIRPLWTGEPESKRSRGIWTLLAAIFGLAMAVSLAVPLLITLHTLR